MFLLSFVLLYNADKASLHGPGLHVSIPCRRGKNVKHLTPHAYLKLTCIGLDLSNTGSGLDNISDSVRLPHKPDHHHHHRHHRCPSTAAPPQSTCFH